MNNYNGILAAVANIQLKHESTQTLYATLTDPNNGDNPYDLSVFDSITAICKRAYSDTVELWKLSLTYTGASNNILVLPFTPIETGLVPGEYKWDVVGLTGIEETPIIEGDFKINASTYD